MNIKHLSVSALIAAALSFSAVAIAAPVTPRFDTFGTLASAPFGGTGIPNTAVAITEVDDVILGLTAHQRYSAAPVTNDGAGRFTAQAGVSAFAPSSSSNPWATWNFGYHIAPKDTAAASDLSFRLLFDQDPASNTTEANLKTAFDLTTAGIAQFGLSQNSWNLGMDFLEVGNVFSPTRNGEYSFALIAYNALGEVARSTIVVNVTGGANEVPTPGTLPLIGLSLLCLAGISRRRRG